MTASRHARSTLLAVPPQNNPRRGEAKSYVPSCGLSAALTLSVHLGNEVRRVVSQPRRRVPLRARYGLNAWRRWALSPADQSHDPKDQDSTTPGEQAPPPKHDSVDIATLFCQRLHQLPVHGQCKMSSQPYLCYRPCYQGYCGSNEVLLHCKEIENKLRYK